MHCCHGRRVSRRPIRFGSQICARCSQIRQHIVKCTGRWQPCTHESHQPRSGRRAGQHACGRCAHTFPRIGRNTDRGQIRGRQSPRHPATDGKISTAAGCIAGSGTGGGRRVSALGADVSQWKSGDPGVCADARRRLRAQCVSPADHALPVPSQMSWEQAAAFPENWFTVRANLIDLAALGPASACWSTVVRAASASRRCNWHGASAPTSWSPRAARRNARSAGNTGATLAINYRTEDFLTRVARIYCR